MAVRWPDTIVRCIQPRAPSGSTTSRQMPYSFTTRTGRPLRRSEEHTSELQSLMRISYAVFCLNKKNNTPYRTIKIQKPQYTTKHQTNNTQIHNTINAYTSHI